MNQLSAEWIDERRGHFDWRVDGRPLHEWLAPWTDHAPESRRDGWLPIRDPETILALGGKGHQARLRSGRARLYVCSQCDDVGCGTFAVRVESADAVIRWSDFAWENEGVSPVVDDAFAAVPPITFERGPYEQVLAELADRFARS